MSFNGTVRNQNENLMSFQISPKCYGFKFEEGVLKGNFGVGCAASTFLVDIPIEHTFMPIPDANLNSKIIDMFIYERKKENGDVDDKLVVVGDSGILYQTSLFTNEDWTVIPNISLKKRACTVNYNYNGKDCLLLASPATLLAIYDGTTNIRYVKNAPKFSSMCVHYERIFGTESSRKNAVWFSDDFNPTNWDVNIEKAGFITFQNEGGAVLKVLSFLDYVYVFREHSIYRLTAYAEQSEFSMTKLFVATGRIYPSTIVQDESKVVFLAEDGLYMFDGFSTKKIGEHLPKIHNMRHAEGALFKGKYYLACNIEGDFLDESDDKFGKNNALIEYDLASGVYNVLKGIEITKILPISLHDNSRIYFLTNGEKQNFVAELQNNGKIFNVPSKKHFETAKNNLQLNQKKLIKAIWLKTTTALKVKVLIDERTYVYNLPGKNEMQKIVVNKSGFEIGLSFDSFQKECLITPPQIFFNIM